MTEETVIDESEALLAAVNTAIDPEPEEPEVEPEKKTEEPEKSEASEEPDKAEELETEKPEIEAAEKPESEKPEPEKTEPASDDLDESVPEKTRERFTALKEKYDAAIAERDAVQQEAQGWVSAIRDTGTNPEQFGMALDYLTKVNSGTQEGLTEAYAIMQKELETLGKFLGKPAPGIYDPLSDHPDLKQRLDEGLLDQAAALEIAESRAARRISEFNSQNARSQASQQQAVDQAINEVKTLSRKLQSTDPAFQSKLPAMEAIIEAAVSGGIPPAQWKTTIEKAYARLPAGIVPNKKPAAPDPIRPTAANQASGLEKEPGSLMEAVSAALDGF